MKKKGKENEKKIKERLICVALVGGVFDNVVVVRSGSQKKEEKGG